MTVGSLLKTIHQENLLLQHIWQQQEYVMGGGSSNYMFLVLAADQLLDKK
jgi:hypothetical protein